MSFFGRLARTLFGGGGGGAQRDDSAGSNAFWLYVRCDACGETIRVRVHREHDLSADYEDGDAAASYHTHKEIVGRSCFRRLKVDLSFNAQRQVSERRIDGGVFITREEYEAAQEAQAPGPSSGA